VPGPCFKALDWQHSLPGYAFDGLGDFWYFNIANCYVLMVRFFDEVDNYLGGVIIHLCTTCNICYLEQHPCVLGMCLMALDLHHMMHAPVHQGHCFKIFGVACMALCSDCIEMLELATCLKHICMARMATPPLSYGFASYRWLCVICGPFSLCILEFQHWNIFGRLSAMSCYPVSYSI